ncbi:DinB/UmuC family translesion DNA polymerase, partial [Klebsiella pneumoniae]|uniref:DinB/UmuC family translesion DNA polymerase n=1 Tax=Klebsiella pneumoniae TaxID=573 RepID=UPI00210EECB5
IILMSAEKFMLEFVGAMRGGDMMAFKARLRAADKIGTTVAITIRYSDFRTISRSHKLPEPTDVTQDVYDTAVLLLDALGHWAPDVSRPPAVRLVGVRVEGL